jgi:hypothetical protein
MSSSQYQQIWSDKKSLHLLAKIGKITEATALTRKF